MFFRTVSNSEPEFEDTMNDARMETPLAVSMAAEALGMTSTIWGIAWEKSVLIILKRYWVQGFGRYACLRALVLREWLTDTVCLSCTLC